MVVPLPPLQVPVSARRSTGKARRRSGWREQARRRPHQPCKGHQGQSEALRRQVRESERERGGLISFHSTNPRPFSTTVHPSPLNPTHNPRHYDTIYVSRPTVCTNSGGASGVEAGGGAAGSEDRAAMVTRLLQTPVYSVSDGRPDGGGGESTLVASRTGEALR